MERSLTIKFDKFIAITILLFLILFLSLGSDFISLEFLSGFSLINTIIVMSIIFKIGKRIFSVSSMFMLFLAVFHFGQAWLYVFGGEVDKTISYDVFALYHDKTIYSILLFSLLSYNLIALFSILLSKNDTALNEPMIELQSEKDLFDRKIIFYFGIAFFFVLLIPVFIYDYLIITITAELGHGGLYDNAGMLSKWAAANSYFPLAIIMVLLSCDPKKNGWKWMYCYAIGRCLLLMILTGKRGSFVIPLLLYIFCKHHFIKKYKRKHIIWIFIASVLLLSMISFISYGRGDYSNMNFFEFMREKNIIVQILSELGASFTTTVLSYNYTLSHGFLGGKSYLGALSVFIPLSDTFFSGIKEYVSVSGLLNPYSPSGGALGGSLFGEMYINFGYYALILSPLYAWAVSKIENIINNANKFSLFAVCSSVYISYGLWLYVRGNLVDVVFTAKRTLYVLILFWIFKQLFGRRRMLYEKKDFDRI